MSSWMMTGCSTGLGRHLAQAVLEAGHNAVVTARDATTVQDLVDAHPGTALGVSLDVTEQKQVSAAVQQAADRFGQIDVLVNNAGYGYRAAVEEGEDDAVAQLFATNFFGAVAMIRAVLPAMRERRHGTIVNISSISARTCPAGSGYYSASKAVLESIIAALRKEVGPLGIAAMVVEPGGFRTDFAGRSLLQAGEAIADYADTAGRRRKENDKTRPPARRSRPRRSSDHHHRRVGRATVAAPPRRGRGSVLPLDPRRQTHRDRRLGADKCEHQLALLSRSPAQESVPYL